MLNSCLNPKILSDRVNTRDSLMPGIGSDNTKSIWQFAACHGPIEARGRGAENTKSIWQFAALAAVVVTVLCVFGSAGDAYGLEFDSADLNTGTQILAVVFDEDVDPDSVDASKFYLGTHASVFNRVALTGADVAVDGATVSFTLDTAQLSAIELIYPPNLTMTIGATAVADSAGDPFGIRLEFVDDTVLRSSIEQDRRYQAQGMDFNSDGTRMFIGYEDHISEYALYPAFDISTAVDGFTGLVRNSTTLDLFTGHFAFSPDGTYLFVGAGTDDSNDIRIDRYTMSSPFNISSLTASGSTDVHSYFKAPTGIAFSTDGMTMFYTDAVNIYQYSLSNAFDLAGASMDDVYFESAEKEPAAVAFSSDGTEVFVLGCGDEIVYKHSLSTPFDLRTANFDVNAVNPHDPNALDDYIVLNLKDGDYGSTCGLAFDNDGTKVFILDGKYASRNLMSWAAVAEFALESYPVTLYTPPPPPVDCADIARPTVDLLDDPPVKLRSAMLNEETGVLKVVFDTAIDRVDPTKFHVREMGSTAGGITLSAADTLSIVDKTISFTLAENQRQAVIALDTPLRLTIDDSAVYISSGDGFVGYMDISTAVHMDSVYTISKDSKPTDIAFSSDGMKMYITGDENNRVYQYALDSPFEVSSASFEHALKTSQTDKIPNGVAFSPDGTCMFLAGNFYHSVYNYVLNDAFDLASHYAFYSTPDRSDDLRMQRISSGNFVVAGFGTPDDVKTSFFTRAPILSDVAFSGDGTSMFTVNQYADKIAQYDLDPHFDMSTAPSSPTIQLDISLVDQADDTSVAFGPGGTTLLVLGDRNIYQYDLDNPFELRGATYATKAPLEGGFHSGVAFDDSGTRMFVVEKAFTNAVHEYMLGPFVMSVIPDNTAPELSSATLQDLTLTATFNESILPGNNQTNLKFTVSAQATVIGEVGLSDITPNISGDTATFTLTHDKVLLIANLTNPVFTVFTDAVQDFSGNYVLYDTEPLSVVEPVPTVDDTAGPEFVSGIMYRQDGVLTVTFNEPVDVTPQPQVNVTGLTITNGTNTVPLGGATLDTTLDSPTIAIQLTAGQQSSMVGLGATLLLDIASGAVMDVSGNSIAASAGNALSDSADDNTPPTVLSATYNTDTHMLTVTFSEILHERINAHLIRFGNSTDNSLQFSLRTTAHDGSIITANLAPTDQQTYFGTSPKLFVSDAAVTDLADNSIIAVSIPITLTANSASLVSAEATANTASNEPPTANAGFNRVVIEGLPVTLSGTASDADNDYLTYSWSHNQPGLITLYGDDTLSPSFTAPYVDSDIMVTFTLTVSDGTDDVSASLDLIIANSNPVPVESQVTPLGPREIGEISLTSTQPGTIQISWEVPSEEPRDYRIAWAKVGEPYLARSNHAGNTFPTIPSQTITDLEEDETYKVKVRARYDSGGSGDWSAEFTVAVAETVTPTPVAETVTPTPVIGPREIGEISLTSTQPGTIQISWEVPSEEPRDYRIAWAKVGEPYLARSNHAGNTFPTIPSQTITDLEEDETYKVKVRARYDSGGSGDWSAEFTVTVART